jgi:hypothetical protein
MKMSEFGADQLGFSMPTQELATLIKKHSMYTVEQGIVLFEETQRHVKPEADTPEPKNTEVEVTKGNFTVYLPTTKAEADQPTKQIPQPFGDLNDLYTERIAEHQGTKATPEQLPSEPTEETNPKLWELRKKLRTLNKTQWHPSASQSECTTDIIDLYGERAKRRQGK